MAIDCTMYNVHLGRQLGIAVRDHSESKSGGVDNGASSTIYGIKVIDGFWQ